MNDINKLLDEIEQWPFGCDVCIVHDFVQNTKLRTQDFQALATAYREQGRVVREAVEELESADEHCDEGMIRKIVRSALSKLKKLE
jgi:hypothetical protein